MGHFRIFPVKTKLSFSPYACSVHVREGRESFLFSQASCTVHVFDSRKFAWKALFWYMKSEKGLVTSEKLQVVHKVKMTYQMWLTGDSLNESFMACQLRIWPSFVEIIAFTDYGSKVGGEPIYLDFSRTWSVSDWPWTACSPCGTEPWPQRVCLSAGRASWPWSGFFFVCTPFML